MARYRSILAFVLVLFTVFVVNCTSVAAAPSNFKTVQSEQIQTFVPKIQAFRDRLPELATMIENRKWNDVNSFIHGPLGELRQKMVSLSRQLSGEAQETALAKAKEVFGHMVRIDTAADEGNYQQAIRNYAEAIKDFDAYLQLIPKA